LTMTDIVGARPMLSVERARGLAHEIDDDRYSGR
jgi:hypothetical protein